MKLTAPVIWNARLDAKTNEFLITAEGSNGKNVTMNLEEMGARALLHQLSVELEKLDRIRKGN